MNHSDIKKFVVKTILEIDDDRDIDENTKLLEEEILDSVSILYLVTELEDEYMINIPVEDIIESNFKDLNCISRYVMSLLG